MSESVLVFPHQLFENHPLISNTKKVFLIEEPLMFCQYNFHVQKLILHRASMQAYKEFLENKGIAIEYIPYSSLQKTEDLIPILINQGISSVSFCDIVDTWIHSKLTKSLDKSGITYQVVDTPMFVTGQEDLDSFFGPLVINNKKFLMKTFYEWQRKRLGILIDNEGKPVGGKWSFDLDNRQKLPKDVILPSDPNPNTNKYVIEAKNYTKKDFGNNYGDSEGFFYPVTNEESKVWLDDFLHKKLELFGPYEDAVTTKGDFLFHSILSPLLNIGLLTPKYVIQKTLEYANSNNVNLASLEGFVRQIIGWREYIRAVYVYHGSKIRKSNYFGSSRNIPSSFWEASTGIIPIDDTIKGALRHAYSHHIPRLMIMGNYMNLCMFEPDQVHKWFMEMYIDAYDWVMVPNVYSMALYADGGMITTKPYISGSSYILKMSDYKKGDWSEIWDSLFWNFVGTHYELLSKEGRLGFIGVTYSKMADDKKLFHSNNAKKYLQSLEATPNTLPTFTN